MKTSQRSIGSGSTLSLPGHRTSSSSHGLPICAEIGGFCLISSLESHSQLLFLFCKLFISNFTCSSILEESPRWTVSHGDIAGARKSLHRINKIDGVNDPEEREHLERMLANEKEVGSCFLKTICSDARG